MRNAKIFCFWIIITEQLSQNILFTCLHLISNIRQLKKTNFTMRFTSVLVGAIMGSAGQSHQAGTPIPAAPTPITKIHPKEAAANPHTAHFEDYLHGLSDRQTLLQDDLHPSFPADNFKSPASTASPSAITLETAKQAHSPRAITKTTKTVGSIRTFYTTQTLSTNATAATTITISTTRTVSPLGYEVPWDTKGQTTTCWTCWGNQLCCDWYDAKTGHPMTFVG